MRRPKWKKHHWFQFARSRVLSQWRNRKQELSLSWTLERKLAKKYSRIRMTGDYQTMMFTFLDQVWRLSWSLDHALPKFESCCCRNLSFTLPWRAWKVLRVHLCAFDKERKEEFAKKATRQDVKFIQGMMIDMSHGSDPVLVTSLMFGWEFADRPRQQFFAKSKANILGAACPSAVDIVSFSSKVFMTFAKLARVDGVWYFFGVVQPG